MNVIIALISGLIFSFGLSLSGMVNPHKVIGFLDIFGNWDPDLLFVMGGALLVNFVTFPLILKKKRPISCESFYVPGKGVIDKKLVLGSAVFGVGWGIMGICPGPAIANLFLLNTKMIVFVIAMIAGMFIYKYLLQKD